MVRKLEGEWVERSESGGGDEDDEGGGQRQILRREVAPRVLKSPSKLLWPNFSDSVQGKQHSTRAKRKAGHMRPRHSTVSGRLPWPLPGTTPIEHGSNRQPSIHTRGAQSIQQLHVQFRDLVCLSYMVRTRIRIRIRIRYRNFFPRSLGQPPDEMVENKFQKVRVRMHPKLSVAYSLRIFFPMSSIQ